MAVNQHEQQTVAPKPATTTSSLSPPSLESAVATTSNSDIPYNRNSDTSLASASSSTISNQSHISTNHITTMHNTNRLQAILPSGGETTATTQNTTTAIAPSISWVPRASHVPHIASSPSSVLLSTTSNPNSHAVPEFLYQLMKMLTDNNRDVIEWSNGKIEVHNPLKLQSDVLNKYFRHSKFASFQRQLNYFGFRKLAGKGKMAPCSYVNEDTSNDIGSLLLVKRKTGNEVKDGRGSKRGRYDRDHTRPQPQLSDATTDMVPSTGRMLYQPSTTSSSTMDTPEIRPKEEGNTSNQAYVQETTQRALARSAVGRGIRHRFSQQPQAAAPIMPKAESSTGPTAGRNTTIIQEGLSALTNNFKNSLQSSGGTAGADQSASNHNRSTSQTSGGEDRDSMPSAMTATASSSLYIPGSLRRDDSLIDLAMIPMPDDDNGENANERSENSGTSEGMKFVDFPWHDPSFYHDGEGKT